MQRTLEFYPASPAQRNKDATDKTWSWICRPGIIYDEVLIFPKEGANDIENSKPKGFERQKI